MVKIHIRRRTGILMAVVFTIFGAMAVSSNFGLFDFSIVLKQLLSVGLIALATSEVVTMSFFRGKFDSFEIIAGLIILLAFVPLIFSFLGTTLAFLRGFEGIIQLLLVALVWIAVWTPQKGE